MAGRGKEGKKKRKKEKKTTQNQDSHLINLSRRSSRHLWQNKPRNQRGDASRCSEEEARLGSPFGLGPVDHERCAKAKHDGDGVRRGESPGSCASAETLLGDFGRVGVADG